MTKQDLPAGWVSGGIGETAEIIRGVSFPRDARKLEPQPDHVACLRTANVQKEVEWADLWFVPDVYVKSESRYVQPLDIIISVSNSLELVGKVAQVAAVPQRTTLGAFISLLRPSSLLNPKFYYYQMASPKFQSGIRYSASTTTNISNISSSKLTEITLNFPPLAEQHRIVAEIETQFTRLDASVAALRRAQANLKRYRASVLRDACEGRLVPTEAELARSEGREYEPAGVLLERILAERRTRWESQEKKRGKYKVPSAPGTSALPELPEGWVWATMPQLGELNRGKSKHRPRNDSRLLGGPYPFVQTGDIRHSGGLVTKHSQTYTDFGLAQSRLWPLGTLCITIAANIAETGILSYDACFPDSVVGFISSGGNVLTKFLEFFIRTEKDELESFAPATAQKNINLQVLSGMATPLPPLAEQRRIVAEVERRLSVIQQAEATVEASLARAERLRQSILKQAFSGRLVPQDPGDEPASALLERIRAEREAMAEASRAAKGKSRTRRARKETA